MCKRQGFLLRLSSDRNMYDILLRQGVFPKRISEGRDIHQNKRLDRIIGVNHDNQNSAPMHTCLELAVVIVSPLHLICLWDPFG